MLSVLDCDRTVDVVFVLDTSGSTEDAFEVSQRLTKLIIQNLNFNNGRTRVGIMLYGDSPVVAFHLNRRPADRQSILDAVAFTLTGGRTHTAAALDMARDTMFQSVNGDRPEARNVMIIITDGMSNINQFNTIPVRCVVVFA